MRAKSKFASLGIVASAILAATSGGISAEEVFARGKPSDVIKSRPITAQNSAQKYQPKRGCFATGTRDASGNFQTVC